MARTVARMAHWLADFADPDIWSATCVQHLWPGPFLS